jgi:hypothetical protein
MKRRFVLFCVLVAIAAAPVLGQFRADVGLNVPRRLGDRTTTLDGEVASESVSIADFFVVFPEVSIAYTSKVGPVTLGGGFRGFTVILQSILYPHVFAEVEFGPIVTGLSVGGGLFPFIGLLNTVHAAGIVVPDLKVQVKLGDSFRLGAGGAAILGAGTGEGTLYALYLSGMFVIDL